MTSPRPFTPSVRVRCGLFGEQFAGMGSPTSQQMGTGDDPVGVQASMGSQETPPRVPPSNLSPSRVSGTGFGFARRGGSPGQERGSRGGPFPVSGILWAPILCPQGFWGLETGARLISTQPVSPRGSFQDGDCCLHQRSSETRRLGGVFGPDGCLLPCPHSQSGQEMVTVRLGGSSLSVQGPSFRPLAGSLGFYQNSQAIGHSATVQGYPHQNVPRRLVSAGGLSGAVCESHDSLLSASSHLGFLSKVGKSDLTPSQRFYFLGMQFDTVSFL